MKEEKKKRRKKRRRKKRRKKRRRKKKRRKKRFEIRKPLFCLDTIKSAVRISLLSNPNNSKIDLRR
jgi:hypothetical protein